MTRKTPRGVYPPLHHFPLFFVILVGLQSPDGKKLTKKTDDGSILPTAVDTPKLGKVY